MLARLTSALNKALRHTGNVTVEYTPGNSRLVPAAARIFS